MADDDTTNTTWGDPTNTPASDDGTVPQSTEQPVEQPVEQPQDPGQPTQPAPVEPPITDDLGVVGGDDLQMTDPVSEGGEDEGLSDDSGSADPDASQSADVMPADENDGTEV